MSLQWDLFITQVLRSTSESHRIFNALWNLDHTKVRLLPSCSLPAWACGSGLLGQGCELLQNTCVRARSWGVRGCVFSSRAAGEQFPCCCRLRQAASQTLIALLS